ncbi:unnamed protein product [Arabidopsis halleri]
MITKVFGDLITARGIKSSKSSVIQMIAIQYSFFR